MYFPYLRGKRHELNSIIKTKDSIIKSGRIIPVIEPVKLSPEHLHRYKEFVQNKIPFIIIINPKQGKLSHSQLKTELLDSIIGSYDKAYFGFLIDDSTDISEVQKFVTLYGGKSKVFIHWKKHQEGTKIQNLINNTNDIKYQIFYTKTHKKLTQRIDKAYISGFTNTNKVMLVEGFKKQSNNMNYEDEELYSDHFSNFSKNKYIGFGDFTITGSSYSEGGGGGVSIIAIHYTYQKDNKIMVKHFLSNKIGTNKDEDEQFLKLLDKFIPFVQTYMERCNSCIGCNEFLRWQREKHYPKLGPVKEASIVHHIELINNLERKTS